jgi:hypothetical protein
LHSTVFALASRTTFCRIRTQVESFFEQWPRHYFRNEWMYRPCENGGISIHGEEMKEKVVVLMELHRAIIYTTEMSKQVMKGHVRDAVHMYPVN